MDLQKMLIAGVFILFSTAMIIGLLVLYARLIPQSILRFLGIFLLVISSIESVLIVWILVYIWNSDWTLWNLSFNDFWKEQLTFIYFIKEWLYTWFWNDFLNLLFAFLPAVVFLLIRTMFTTVIGIWFLKLSRQPS